MDGDMELELDDLPPKMLRKMLRQLLAKKNKPRSEQGEDAEDKSEDEREDLADLHEEHTGKGPDIPVTDEDLPESLRGDSEEEEEPKKKDSKRSK